MKKYNESFDVPMGAFNSAQIADVVGIYILDTLSRIVNLNQVGLYRDDGLIFVPSSNGPITSSLHKKVVRAFKYLGLKIEISSNLKIVNFLDITLNHQMIHLDLSINWIRHPYISTSTLTTLNLW